MDEGLGFGREPFLTDVSGDFDLWLSSAAARARGPETPEARAITTARRSLAASKDPTPPLLRSVPDLLCPGDVRGLTACVLRRRAPVARVLLRCAGPRFLPSVCGPSSGSEGEPPVWAAPGG